MNQSINQWLRLLAGNDDNHQKLLDWLACAPNLDTPLCGLIFAGPPKTSKGLFLAFVAGLREIWNGWRSMPNNDTPILVYRDDPKALSTIDPITLDAYPRRRFVVATNTPEIMLAHVHERTPLEQLERWFLYMEPTEEAAELLEGFEDYHPVWGVRHITTAIETLHQYHKVERAGHLWVEGTPGAMRHLTTQPPKAVGVTP